MVSVFPLCRVFPCKLSERSRTLLFRIRRRHFIYISMAPPSHLFRPMKSSIQRGNISILTQDIHLRLSTLPLPRSSASYPLHFSKDPGAPSLILTQLTLVRNLIYQSLDVVDVSTWTGDAHDPSFIAGQLRLLFDFIQEARQNLKGGEDAVGVKWWQVYTDEKVFIHIVMILRSSLAGCCYC